MSIISSIENLEFLTLMTTKKLKKVIIQSVMKMNLKRAMMRVVSNDDKDYTPYNVKDKAPKQILKKQLNDLVKDLGLPKDKEYLTLFMKDKNWLEKDVKVDCFHNTEETFR